MDEIIKHINDTNASFRSISAGDAKNTDLFLDNEHYELFKDAGEQITVRFNKENLSQAILFIASILPRKYDNSSIHKKIQYSTEFVFEQLALLNGFFTINGRSVDYRTQTWNARKDVPKKNGEIDSRFYFNGLLEDVSYTNSKGELVTSKFTIRNYLAGGYSNLHIKKSSDGIFDVMITNTSEYLNEDVFSVIDKGVVLQQIYFGAPGTGKSFAIDKVAKKYNSVRTTFHPDSDYSTFVGCYKPCKSPIKDKYSNVLLEELIDKANEITSRPAGDKVGYIIDFVTQYAERLCQIVEENDGIISLNYLLREVLGFSNETYLSKVISKTLEERNEKAEITYEFRSQAFTDAYVNAWKNLEEPYYLVIEEINRGNCAQIFGDIFQLLDRDSKSGYSSYKITPDKDLQEYLCKEFAKADIEDEEIKQGIKMQLPSNLNILATMNTSDQSLFPIDSAFKRRWDWKYIPINPKENEAYIVEKKYSWNSFLKIVNDHIESVTLSEDKKMGAWFVKADNKGCISAEKFVSKVVFYLWNDIFKDFSHDGNTIFKDEYKSFHKFFNYDGSVNTDILMKFLNSFNIDSESKTEESQA